MYAHAPVDPPLDAETDHPFLDDTDATGLLAHLRSTHGVGSRMADVTFRRSIGAISGPHGVPEEAILRWIHRLLHLEPPPSTA